MTDSAGTAPDPDPPQGPAPRVQAATDPVAGLLLALRDVWGVGLSAMQAMAAGLPAGSATAAGLAGTMGDMLGRAGGRAGDAATGDASPRSTEASPPDRAGLLAPAMAEAAAAASASALRYWRDLAEISLRHQALLLQAATGAGGTDAAAAGAGRGSVEAFRAALREVGDAALLEARRLQRDLEEIGEAAARADQETGPAANAGAAPFQRRWKAKE